MRVVFDQIGAVTCERDGRSKLVRLRAAEFTLLRALARLGSCEVPDFQRVLVRSGRHSQTTRNSIKVQLSTLRRKLESGLGLYRHEEVIRCVRTEHGSVYTTVGIEFAGLTTACSVMIPDGVAARLDKVAERYGESRAKTAARAISAGIGRLESVSEQQQGAA